MSLPQPRHDLCEHRVERGGPSVRASFPHAVVSDRRLLKIGQGRLFAAPAPAERVEAYLTDHRSPSL
ncbi:hypothetical protein HC028_15545 [Planosporangium flavigriseum]|uniref:Uncharacterized protein n=1 Tax=Planosporangium flavigriseum TaxID=373681 RepID=A0A8J3PQ18_9ACTN|nr:hypothetical protein [Planosporangium flavigriseum]NJC65905.1 hypothetical protein [Planosporangium flavigriseum]GIG75611.1 hypothetical protein Pfl04_40150 [Planosporangium flavigriseum]